MDQTTFNSLQSRILGLEVQLNANQGLENGGSTSTPKDQSIMDQIASIQSRLDKFYKENTEMNTLNNILTDLKLWGKLDDLPPSVGSEEAASEPLLVETKEQIILLKYPQIKQAYNNLIEMANMDIDKIVNYIDSTQFKNHDFKRDHAKILERKKTIDEITKNFHLLVVKNMIVYEKYLNLVIEENQFWINTDEKTINLEKSVKNHESNDHYYNKY